MKQVALSEFISYLTDQLGQPYVWGGQHLKLTPENYVREITKREKDATHRATAIKYCENRFEDGKTVLYAYDCSGLGMYYLQNVEKVYSYDMSANSMMKQCTLMDEPKKGYWVFRLNDKGKAVHIGYMVSDTEVIEAKGRAYGVVKGTYRSKDWNIIGVPKCVKNDVPEPETYIFTRELKYGMEGQDVVELKKLLIAHGFSKGITTDTASSKRFGSATRRQVKLYQKSVKLKADGIAGHFTIVTLGGIWMGD